MSMFFPIDMEIPLIRAFHNEGLPVVKMVITSYRCKRRMFGYPYEETPQNNHICTRND